MRETYPIFVVWPLLRHSSTAWPWVDGGRGTMMVKEVRDTAMHDNFWSHDPWSRLKLWILSTFSTGIPSIHTAFRFISTWVFRAIACSGCKRKFDNNKQLNVHWRLCKSRKAAASDVLKTLKENKRHCLDNIATFGQLPVTQDEAQGSDREEEDVQIFPEVDVEMVGHS